MATYATELKGAGAVDDIVAALDGLVKRAVLQQVTLVEVEAVCRVGVGGHLLQVLDLVVIAGIAHCGADTGVEVARGMQCDVSTVADAPNVHSRSNGWTRQGTHV